MPRPIWSGAISFGLVTIPVKVVSAIAGEHAVKFHQMHATDQGRVRYRKVCELDGEVLGPDDIVRGYTAPDGRVATIEDAELDDLPLPTAHTVEVQAFIDVGDLDPVQLGKPYYLTAGQGGSKAYVLMRDALRRSGKAGVAKLAMRGKESLALIRPHGDVLVLHQLYWPDEINPSGQIATATEKATVTDAELDAADALIESIGPADLASMRDEYAAAVAEMVSAKLGDSELPDAAPEREPAPVMDLMAALRQSLEDAEKNRAKPKTKKSTAKKTAAKKTTTGGGGGRKAS